MHKTIARITSTFLGASEDTHGIFTAQIGLSYGAGNDIEQSAGNYNLGGDTGFAGAFVRGLLAAAGVSSWEQLKGRIVLVLTERDPEAFGGRSPVLGLEPLPTERGTRFIFNELSDQYAAKAGPR